MSLSCLIDPASAASGFEVTDCFHQLMRDTFLACVPPNEPVRLAPNWKHFTVPGAGKTAIDSVLWLLTHGEPPDHITWVLPRDPWLSNSGPTSRPSARH
jgi:hypothetical protein